MYKRVLVKLSGGALGNSSGNSFGNDQLEHITKEILALANQGIEICVLVGGESTGLKLITLAHLGRSSTALC